MAALRGLRKFPRARPTGCARMLAVPHMPGELKIGGNEGDRDGAKDLEGIWKGVAACAELELCGMCDKLREGRPDERYVGERLGQG